MRPFAQNYCVIPEVFQVRPITIPLLSDLFGVFNSSEFHIHVYVLTFFGGFIAPFGGFFASALKRGLKIKAI